MVDEKEIAVDIITWCQTYRWEEDPGKLEIFFNTIMGSNDHEFFLALNEITSYGWRIADRLNKRPDMFKRLKEYHDMARISESPYFRLKPPETKWYKRIARKLWGNDYVRII